MKKIEASDFTNCSRQELFSVIGEMFMSIQSLTELNKSLASRVDFLDDYSSNIDQKYHSLLQKYESMDEDLKKAMSLADLSQQGADTPNPFPGALDYGARVLTKVLEEVKKEK